MKKFSFKDLRKRTKVLIIVFLIVALPVLCFYMFTTLRAHWSKKDTEVPTASETLTEMTTTEATTTSAPSSEDISAMVSEMVESRVAEELAKMDSTSAVTQPAETTVTTVVPQEVTTAVTTTEPTEDGNTNVSEDSFITFLQGDTSYTVPCMSSKFEAAFYSTFCESNGRDIYVQVPDYVTSISISISFRDVDNNLSEFSDFEELTLMQTENGREAQYSIPDNPLRNDGYFVDQPRFFGVFRLETTDGFEYFSISY